MKPAFSSYIVRTALLVGLVASNLLNSTITSAQEKKNDAGLAIQLGSFTSIGIQGKVGLSDNFSLRPELLFGSGNGVENRSFTTPVNILGIPAGTTIPAGRIGSNLSGTSLGLAATYDFKLDTHGKSTAYIGPKFTFSSASGTATVNGNQVPGSQLNIDETKFGLVAGADFDISNDITIGANITYNLSRNISGTGSLGAQNLNINNIIQPAGSALDFGIRASYRF